MVAPSQTLTDREYQMLRSASLRIIRALGIEGGCNVQYALRPSDVVAEAMPGDWDADSPYYVIEVNPRVSPQLRACEQGHRLSDRTAWPPRLPVGKRLDEIPNAVTRRTLAAFEPALDYCVVKIPRWPFDKFAAGNRVIGTQMKATGEVMAIDRSFEAAFQKAVRSLEIGNFTIMWEDSEWRDDDGVGLGALPMLPTDLRLWALMAALRRGISPEDIARSTGIDPWFLYRFRRIVDMERRLLEEDLTPRLLWEAKRLGLLGRACGHAGRQAATAG